MVSECLVFLNQLASGVRKRQLQGQMERKDEQARRAKVGVARQSQHTLRAGRFTVLVKIFRRSI